jgi:rhodanese-related sulfurtransferase
MNPLDGAGNAGGDIDPGTTARLLADRALTVLDVREHDEWDAGHIDGARHVPLAALGSLVADSVGLDPSRPVVAVCRSGNRSARAAAALRTAGLTVHNMAGGMTAWAEAGLPVTSSSGTPGTIR